MKKAPMITLDEPIKVKKNGKVLYAIAYNRETGDYLLDDASFVNQSKMKGLKNPEPEAPHKLSSYDYIFWAYQCDSVGYQIKISRNEDIESELEQVAFSPIKTILKGLVDAALGAIDLNNWILPQDVDYEELFDDSSEGNIASLIEAGHLVVQVRKVLQSDDLSNETIQPLEDLVRSELEKVEAK